MENIGKLIFGIGVILVVVGLGFWLFADKLGWVGNLPGDIKVANNIPNCPNRCFYFPDSHKTVLVG